MNGEGHAGEQLHISIPNILNFPCLPKALISRPHQGFHLYGNVIKTAVDLRNGRRSSFHVLSRTSPFRPAMRCFCTGSRPERLPSSGKRKRVSEMKKKNRLPALAMAGPVSLWMVLFVTVPMFFIIFISFMSRGIFGDVVYDPSMESYLTLLDSTYFNVISKSLKVAAFTTLACLGLGYPFAYYIAKRPKDQAAKYITLIMIPFWTNTLMRLNSWLLLFQTSGPVNNFLQNSGITDAPVRFVYTDELVALGMITSMLPFAVLPMYSPIEKLNKSLLEASADLGADARTTFKNNSATHVPGIFSAIILVFSFLPSSLRFRTCWAAEKYCTSAISSRINSA